MQHLQIVMTKVMKASAELDDPSDLTVRELEATADELAACGQALSETALFVRSLAKLRTRADAAARR